MSMILFDRPYGEMSAEEQCKAEKAAHEVLRAVYWDTVRTIANDAIQAVGNGLVSSYEEFCEYVAESVDGSEYTLYTAKALQCLRYSDHESAACDIYGSSLFEGCNGVPWRRIACCALRQDVLVHLSDRGYGTRYFNRGHRNEEAGDE